MNEQDVYYRLGKLVGALLMIACFVGVAAVFYGFILLAHTTIHTIIERL